MIETLANGYSSVSTQRELSNEYEHNRVKMVFKNILHICALVESSLGIGRVNIGVIQDRAHHSAVYEPA